MKPAEQEQVDRVRLVDLEIIKRYSLAVREEWVPAEELLAVLDATRAEVQAAITPAPEPGRTARKPRARRRASTDREP